MKGQSVRSDAELIQECQSGHLDAFRLLVERYQAQAFAHALSLLRNREDSLEAVQDGLVSAWRAIDRFDLSRPFYPWLYVILRNRCYRNLETRSRRSEVASVDLDQCRLVTAPDETEARELDDALRALAPQDREIILLRHFDGLKYSELADRLEIPPGTVMSRLYHARRRLRQLLEEPDEVPIENRSLS